MPQPAAESSQALTPERLRAACNATLARLLVPGAAVLAAVYALMAIVHLGLAPEAGRTALTSAAAVSAALFLGISWACRRRPPQPYWAHPIAAGAAAIALTNIALHLHYVPDPPSTVQVAALALCAGLVLLSRTWLAVELAACAALWVVFAWLHPPLARWVDAGYLLAATCAVSALVHEGRLRATGRGEALRRLAMRHRDEARAALARAEREFRERSRVAQEQRELDARVAEAQRVESLGVLAGGVAHDFNNLLSTILGSAEAIQEQLEEDDELRSRAGDIIVATRSAADLTRQMLTYVGRTPVALGPVNLKTLSDTLLPLARASLPAWIAFRLECADFGTSVRGDPTQLQQVLLNLITNAGEALGEQGSSLRVAIGPALLDEAALARCAFRDEAAPGDYVEIAVTDDGPGIPAEIRARIFDPFFSTKFTGRGLGLAAVHGIVRLHGGALDLESKEGEGTTVRAFLPRVSGAERALPAALPAATRAAVGPPPARGIALVLDDDEQVCVMCGRLLNKIGYRAETFTDPFRALEWATTAEIEVAVVDLSMAGLAGDEFVQQIRRAKPHLPVVLMSGYREHRALERAEAMGAVIFLQKPYGIRDLEAACDRAVAALSRGAEAQLAAPESSIDSSTNITGISSSIG